jgi:DinB superfamily
MNAYQISRPRKESRKIMKLTTAYLQQQFSNLNGVFHALVSDLTDEEWMTRSAPGQNMIGFTVWRMPRMQDHFLQTWMRGQTEVAYSDRWSDWEHLKPFGIGTGLSMAETDQIACSTRLGDVLMYADEVLQTVLAWLAEVDEDVLDQIPPAQQRLAAFPEYQTRDYVEAVRSFYGLPVRGLLLQACLGQIYRHLDQLEISKDSLRDAQFAVSAEQLKDRTMR